MLGCEVCVEHRIFRDYQPKGIRVYRLRRYSKITDKLTSSTPTTFSWTSLMWARGRPKLCPQSNTWRKMITLTTAKDGWHTQMEMNKIFLQKSNQEARLLTFIFPPEILISLSSSGNNEIYRVYAYLDMDNPLHAVYFYCIFTSLGRNVLNSHLQLHKLVDI